MLLNGADHARPPQPHVSGHTREMWCRQSPVTSRSDLDHNCAVQTSRHLATPPPETTDSKNGGEKDKAIFKKDKKSCVDSAYLVNGTNNVWQHVMSRKWWLLMYNHPRKIRVLFLPLCVMVSSCKTSSQTTESGLTRQTTGQRGSLVLEVSNNHHTQQDLVF